MKEVKFRWVDRILINMTIQEKFHVLFWFPLLVIVLITAVLIHQNNQLRRTDLIEGLGKVRISGEILLG
jgi:uncharacterized membrane protein affecting hemolysin expression